jgi:hypothetical protein
VYKTTKAEIAYAYPYGDGTRPSMIVVENGLTAFGTLNAMDDKEFTTPRLFAGE